MKDRHPNLTAAGVLLGVTVLFYWKILLTTQFSLLTSYEGANQAYSWLNFWVRSIQQGAFPLWDPYTYSGHTFPGEMQTGAFYPLYFPLALFRLNRYGLLPPSLYHAMYALSHFLAAWFMFRLVRELHLGDFPAIVAGICFSLAGLMAHLPDWPHMLNSGMWLPLIFLLLLRAIKATGAVGRLAYAAACGLGLGLSILAGGLHMAMMQAIVVVTAAAFHGFQTKQWRRDALIVCAAALVAFAAGAVQLLPSMEYSHQALRFVGGAAVPASQSIPYRYFTDRFYAHGILNLLLAVPRTETGFGEVLSPYIGVFPLLLAAIGVWKKWRCPWVSYLTGLAIAAFGYAMGPASLLHGALYALTPYLWLAREADRFVYLTGFALAILAAYGLEALLTSPAPAWETLGKILKWVAAAAILALVIPMLYGQPALSPWISLSLVLIVVSWMLFRYAASGHTGAGARCLMLALILFDLSAFDFSAADRNEMSAKGLNEMDRLISCRGAVQFLKAQPGLFRARFGIEHSPNIGDAYAVQETGGSGVTLAADYAQSNGHADLLNVRYTIKPASAPDAGPVYQDAAWKVYENPSAYPRAWLVHDTIVEPVPLELLKRLDAPDIDPHRVALLPTRLDTALDAALEAATEQVAFDKYESNHMDLHVESGGRALLVLSELFYPGWTATVNGQATPIWKVDGMLRGIVVPQGKSRVALRYRPVSIYIGAVLSIAAFSAVLLGAGWLWFTRRRQHHAFVRKIGRPSLLA